MVRFLRETEEERERDKIEQFRSNSLTDSFKFLPEEIKLEILTRLPVISVLDSKLVCTNWRKIISHHPSFSKMHFHHHLNHPSAESGKLGFLVSTCTKSYEVRLHYFEYDDQSTIPIKRIIRVNLTSPIKQFWFVGSCDGLICLLDYKKPPSVCICNPITREYIILPEIRDCDIDKQFYNNITFGYVPSTNEYKVVVTMYKRRETHFQVHIYTLGSGNGWKNLGKFNCGSNLFIHQVFFANGALYWKDHELKMIRTFDLAEENFCQHVSPPPLPPHNLWFYYEMGVLDGFLYFSLEAEVDGFYDIWLLNKKNHDHDKEQGEEHQSLGLSKVCRIEDMKSMEMLAVTKRGGVLSYKGNHFINIYDTNTSTSKSLVQFYSYIRAVFPHKNSLVSLKELGEEDAKVMELTEIEEIDGTEQSQEDADLEFIYL